MIRDLLSAAITAQANEVLQIAKGDIWRSDQFVVLFKQVNYESPAVFDGVWEGVVNLTGEIYVQIFTDGPTPIDPTPLIIALRENPIFIEPPMETPAGHYAVQLFWKPERVRDQIYSERVIVQMEGELKNAYVLKRLEDFPTITEVSSNL